MFMPKTPTSDFDSGVSLSRALPGRVARNSFNRSELYIGNLTPHITTMAVGYLTTLK